MLLLIGQGGVRAAPTITGVSTSTAYDDTAMPGVVEGGMGYLKTDLPSGPIWAGTPKDASGSTLVKVFDRQGALLCSENRASSASIFTLAIHSSLVILFGEQTYSSTNVKLFSMKLAFMNGGFAASQVLQVASDPLTDFNHGSLSWPDTAFVYFGQASGSLGAGIVRVDTSATVTGVRGLITGGSAGSINGDEKALVQINSDFILITFNWPQSIYVLNRLTYSIAKEFTGLESQCLGLFRNNLDSDEYYYFSQAQQSRLKKASAAPTGQPLSPLMSFTTQENINHVMNFGQVSYIGVSVYVTSLAIVDKATFLAVAGLPLKSMSIHYSTSDSVLFDGKHYFGQFSIYSPYNFQSYYVRFDEADGLKVLEAVFSVISNTLLVKFDADIKSVASEELRHLELTLRDQETNTVQKCVLSDQKGAVCQRVEAKYQNQILIKLNLKESVLKGQLSLRDTSGNTIRSLQNEKTPDYPIEAPFSFLVDSTSENLRGMVIGMQVALGAATSFMNVCMISFDGALSIVLDRLLMDLVYLKLVNGPVLVYPSIVLSFLSFNPVFGIPIPNLFETFLREPFCSPVGVYRRNGLGCSIYFNYGDNLVALILLLGCTLAVVPSISFFQRRRCLGTNQVKPASNSELDKSNCKPSHCAKLPQVLRTYYGLRFFVTKMEGLRMEVLLFCMVNLLSHPVEWVVALGTVLSCFIFAYYGIYSFFIFKKIKEIKACLSKPLQLDSQQLRQGSLVRFLQSEQPEICESRLIFLFEDMKFTDRALVLYSPLVTVAQDFCIQTLVVAFSPLGIAQPILLALIEIGYAVYQAVAMPNLSAWSNRVALFNRGCICLYLILRAFTYLEMKATVQQAGLGLVMALLLLVVIFFNLCYNLALGVYVIGGFIRARRCPNKSTKDAVAKTTKIEDGAEPEKIKEAEQKEEKAEKKIVEAPEKLKEESADIEAEGLK